MNFRRSDLIGKTVLVATIVAMICAAGGNAYSEDDIFPNTWIGEVVRAYFESLNSGDEQTVLDFTKKYRSQEALEKRSPEERVPRTLGMHAQVGIVVPKLIVDESETSITVIAHSEKLGMWMKATFEFEVEEPYKLTSIMMQPTSPPEMDLGRENKWDIEWEDLAGMLEEIRSRTGIPAIGAAIIEDGRVVDQAVIGVRQAGTDKVVSVDDRFHIGSIGKSITATMIGRLVEKGVVDWGTKIADVLGDMEMRPEYRDVTLAQLVQHRGGFPGFLVFEDEEEERLNALPGIPTEVRTLFVGEVLNSDPVATPGTTMNYSNGGYVVAALMAERAAGTSWEELMQEYVFGPAGMRHAAFGWPATASDPDQPLGHVAEGEGFRNDGLMPEYPFDCWIAPAGNISCSIRDLATYAQTHLDGLAGKDGVLSAETIEWLHTVPEGSDRYAGGWMIMESDGGVPVHTHSGGAGSFFATVSLYPSENRAIVLVMNIGMEGMEVSDKIIELVNTRRAESTQ